MNIKYFKLRGRPVVQTRDLDENTVMDFDVDGQLVALTIEHASERADIPRSSFEQVSEAA